MSNSRPRRRRRSSAEQMFWDRLSVAERVAFTVGYSVGQGHPFPPPAMLDELRTQIAADRRRATSTRPETGETPAPYRATPRTPAQRRSKVKAIVDGLVDAAVWPDDTNEFVVVLDPRFYKPSCPIAMATVNVHLIPRAGELPT